MRLYLLVLGDRIGYVHCLVPHVFCTVQASKLGMGKNRGIVSYYSGHQVVQFNHHPLVVTFVAQTDANTGTAARVCHRTYLLTCISDCP